MAAAEVCDYLIIGGGTAGPIVARRLADRTSGRIILLEAGRSDENDPAALDLSRLDDQGPAYDWGYHASPLPGAPADLVYARAKMLGGCANHNDCAFIEPPPSDIDRWASLGATGWTAEACATYFRRVRERVHVETPTEHHPVSEAFVAAGQELGLPLVDFTREVRAGVGWFPLNAKGALRQSTSVAYLHPLAKLPKHLEVWTETRALRLTFDGRRCTGAQTTRGMIKARREVILAAGSIATPHLLMLSGVGPAEQLRAQGIALVHDAPGVGQNLLDHVAAGVVFATREPVAPWALTPFEATMLLQLENDAPAPDVLFHFGLRVREKYGDARLNPDGLPAVKASPNVARARSTGEVRLASGNPQDAPVIRLNYFTDPEGYDRRILLAAVRFARSLLGTRALSAVCSHELAPGPDVESEAELEAYIRSVCETVYHPIATCRMGTDERAVVDPDLNVKGIEHLRIVDASVIPSMLTVNINNTVMMVAERAADLVLAAG
ncbi:MAG: GMC family oxidoreductase N-terminal domain-containing protein [Hyphomicrobiales bacterium]